MGKSFTASELFLVSGRVRDLEIVRLVGEPGEYGEDKFSCTVNDIRIEGTIARVTFLEGEAIDFAVHTLDGKNIFEAARSNTQRKIWLPSAHYHWTGHVALLKSGLIWMVVPMIIAAVAMGIVMLLQLRESTTFFILLMAGMTYLMLLFFVGAAQLLTYPSAKRTSAILALFGYADPAAHSLHDMNLQAVTELQSADPSIVLRHELSSYRF